MTNALVFSGEVPNHRTRRYRLNSWSPDFRQLSHVQRVMVSRVKSWSAEYIRTNQRIHALLARQPLLLRRHNLPDLDRRHRDELFVHQVGARQRAVKRRAAFAQQVLNAESRAELPNRRRQVEPYRLLRRRSP